MGKKGGVNVRMENNDVKGSVIGADTVNVDSTHYGGNVRIGDKFSGTGSSKVEGNVKNLSMRNIAGPQHDENEQSEHDESDAESDTSDSEEGQSPQTRMAEAVPPTSDIGEDLATILPPNQPEDYIRNVEASLRDLGIDSVQHLGFVNETELREKGIKMVHARMLKAYYETNFSEQKKSLSKDAIQSPSKAKSNVGRKRNIPVGRQKNPKKTRTASAKKQSK